MAAPWSRRDFLRAAAATATAQLACSGPSGSTLQRPNILFILADDHPNSALSCYGSKVIHTPNLDRIAEEGVRFDNAYVTTSLCAPSRASFLTGTYPHINGQVAIPRIFDGEQATFPNLLRESGYETALIGKWHLVSEPVGFDSWNVLIAQGEYHDPEMVDNGVLRQHEGYVTDIITDLSLDWLKNRSGDRPFCLLCHHKAPHYVWEPDDKHEHSFDEADFPLPGNFDDTHEGRVSPREADLNVADMHELGTYRRWPARGEMPEGLTPDEAKRWNYREFMKDVMGCVASIDENVGRLLDYLDEAGLAENTIVVYASDNGYFLGEHGWTDKKVIYEESIRIPLLVRYPAAVAAGQASDDFVLNIDLAPTLLDIAGEPIPGEIQGRSLRPILDGASPDDWRQSIYYQLYHASSGIARRLPHYGIRTRRYKLAYWYREILDWELYDLEKDPTEMRNVYADPAYADVVGELKERLERLRTEYGITEEMEQDFAEKTAAGYWNEEVNEYRSRKRQEYSVSRP